MPAIEEDWADPDVPPTTTIDSIAFEESLLVEQVIHAIELVPGAAKSVTVTPCECRT